MNNSWKNNRYFIKFRDSFELGKIEVDAETYNRISISKGNKDQNINLDLGNAEYMFHYMEIQHMSAKKVTQQPKLLEKKSNSPTKAQKVAIFERLKSDPKLREVFFEIAVGCARVCRVGELRNGVAKRHNIRFSPSVWGISTACGCIFRYQARNDEYLRFVIPKGWKLIRTEESIRTGIEAIWEEVVGCFVENS